VEDENGFRDAAELPIWQTVGEEGERKTASVLRA
jgi:hypothetical protein